MNTQTGELLSQEEMEELFKNKTETKEEVKHIVKLSPELAQRMSSLNRQGRREYYKNHKEEFLTN